MYIFKWLSVYLVSVQNLKIYLKQLKLLLLKTNKSKLSFDSGFISPLLTLTDLVFELKSKRTL